MGLGAEEAGRVNRLLSLLFFGRVCGTLLVFLL